jgi:hypothetical protein
MECSTSYVRFRAFDARKVMIFSLDVRRARKGDCLLLHYGPSKDPHLVMIDGGPRGVYGCHLKPRITQIRKVRGLPDDKPLAVDLLIVSHVDDDHIQGILDLTKELLEAKRDQRPQWVQVLSLWHNSFDDIIDHKPDELMASMKTQFGVASVGGSGELSEAEKTEVEDRYARSNPEVSAEDEGELVTSTLKVLASIEQGSRLRSDADALEFPLNPEFDGKLILAPHEEAIDIGQGLLFRVVGPGKVEVEALRKRHDAWLKELREKGKSPPEALAAYVDKSVPNLSSLVFLAQVGDKSMLLTGDARGDKILAGLQIAGLLDQGNESKIEVDLLKVPHHGSSNNLEIDFFERIIAKHYVFSGDGEHGNPERQTLEMLLAARAGDADYQVHLTYPVGKIDEERKRDWEKEQRKEEIRKEKKPDIQVRKNWSPKDHGLREFFGANPAFERKVMIVAEEQPHVIDLADPLGF